MQDRIICWFSAGAASAVATKIALEENAGRLPIEIVYTRIVEEHPDNERFVRECEEWFDHPIQLTGNDKYGSSIYEVFRKTRYLVGPSGARCTEELKKAVRRSIERPKDIQVFGYTFEEQDRVDRFLDANAYVNLSLPLVDRKLTKADCLAVLRSEDIELPEMYRLGYKNNNCIGCVKGGAGYWNKIRLDFPETFERMAKMEEHLGRTVLRLSVEGEKHGVPLRQLDPEAGRYEAEPDIECGVVCMGVITDIYLGVETKK
jgi:hypothetical protein